MRLYRGISVNSDVASEVIDKIRSEGIRAGEGRQWSMTWNDLKPRLDDLRRLNTLTYEDTKGGEKLPKVCACGDETGATYYACHHNRSGENNTPILITFESEVADVIVDGRDFLYAIFQGGDPKRARDVASRVFGGAILHYLDSAWTTQNQQERIAWCDLAVQDDEVITAHALNTMVIGGRYNTRFCSAFMARLPVPSIRIIDVRELENPAPLPDAEVSLFELRVH